MNEQHVEYQEKVLRAPNGLGILLLNIVLMLAAVAGIVFSAMQLSANGSSGGMVALLVVCIFYWCLPCWLLFAGIKVLGPNEALVLTLFGTYVGTLKGEGIFFVNPFCTSVNPAAQSASEAALTHLSKEENPSSGKIVKAAAMSKKLSLKTMTLNNDKQKINDLLGNPIVIGIAVIWHIEDTAKAVFAVDNYQSFCPSSRMQHCVTPCACIRMTYLRAATKRACAARRRRSRACWLRRFRSASSVQA